MHYFFVETGLSTVWSIFFFQAKKKEAKKSPGHLRLCPGLKAPGRNYKLLPALATNSPPDCLRSASRPQRFGGVERQDALRLQRFNV